MGDYMVHHEDVSNSEGDCDALALITCFSRTGAQTCGVSELVHQKCFVVYQSCFQTEVILFFLKYSYRHF